MAIVMIKKKVKMKALNHGLKELILLMKKAILIYL